jgi:hypothetical protein
MARWLERELCAVGRTVQLIGILAFVLLFADLGHIDTSCMTPVTFTFFKIKSI